MVVYEGVGLLLLLALWLFCLIDVITTDESESRNLPKLMWLLIVLVLPDVGSVLWLVAGRPQGRGRPGTTTSGRARSPVTTANPDDDEEFLRGIRHRAEEQRRIARERKARPEQPLHEDDPDAG